MGEIRGFRAYWRNGRIRLLTPGISGRTAGRGSGGPGMAKIDEGEVFSVDALVSHRTREPIVQISTHRLGKVAQLSVAQARKIAGDIVQAAARAEADAMLVKWFNTNGFPEAGLSALLVEFREFRRRLDEEPVTGTMTDPDTGERIL